MIKKSLLLSVMELRHKKEPETNSRKFGAESHVLGSVLSSTFPLPIESSSNPQLAQVCQYS